jgi:hypothetical protein
VTAERADRWRVQPAWGAVRYRTPLSLFQIDGGRQLTTIRRAMLAGMATMNAALTLTSLAVARAYTSAYGTMAAGGDSQRHHGAGRGSALSSVGGSKRFSSEVIKTGRPHRV